MSILDGSENFIIACDEQGFMQEELVFRPPITAADWKFTFEVMDKAVVSGSLLVFYFKPI
ncbi:MAG: hypothetical protein ACTHLE_19640 [Agriterribacter sp.]